MQIIGPPRPQRRAIDRREQPLVRVDDDRIGALDSLPGPAELRADHRRAGVRGVDVQPDVLALADLGQVRDRIDRGRRRRPDRGDQCTSSFEPAQPVRSHPKLGVGRDLLDRQSQQPRRLLDRRMCVLRAEHGPARVRLPCRRQRRERRGRSRVLDVPVPLARQPEQLGEPIHRHQLELGRRGRGPPEDLRHVQRRGQELGEDPRLRAGGREIGEEAGVLPVRDPRQQHLVEVAQHRRERLGDLRRRLGQRPPDLARLDLCEHRQLPHPLEVRGCPLERRSAVVAEIQPSSFLICGHVRVFSTCSFVSQARRAWPTPSSG